MMRAVAVLILQRSRFFLRIPLLLLLFHVWRKMQKLGVRSSSDSCPVALSRTCVSFIPFGCGASRRAAAEAKNEESDDGRPDHSERKSRRQRNRRLRRER